jgi:hypothetical protein
MGELPDGGFGSTHSLKEHHRLDSRRNIIRFEESDHVWHFFARAKDPA